jgi:hypothetical protein
MTRTIVIMHAHGLDTIVPPRVRFRLYVGEPMSFPGGPRDDEKVAHKRLPHTSCACDRNDRIDGDRSDQRSDRIDRIDRIDRSNDDRINGLFVEAPRPPACCIVERNP